MASYNELNALIDAYINRNGVQAITGQILNGVLKAMVEQLGRGYTIMGAATPTTDPGTPDGPECYFASETGIYTDFGGLQVVPGELALLCYTPSDGWTKATIYEGFREVGATIDGNVGTPSVGVSYADGVLSFDFHNMKGNPGQNGQDGAAAGFGTIGADITGGVGTPAVSVESSGPATAKNLQFHFTNLKGETGVTSVVATVDNTTGTPACTVSLEGQQLTLAFSGLKGAQGDTGSSVDYPFTIVNNLTTNDATQALSAAQGVVLAGQVSQLEAKVTEMQIPVKYTNGYIKTSDSIGTVVDINSYVSLAPWMCYVTTCKAGDTVIVSGTGGQSPRLWAFLDKDYKIISQSASNATENGHKIIAPQDSAFVIVNDKSGKLSYLFVDANLTDIELRLEAQESYTNEKLLELEAKVYESQNTQDAEVHQVNTSSTVETTSGTRLRLLYYVKPGYIISASCNLGSGIGAGVYSNKTAAIIASPNDAIQVIQDGYAESFFDKTITAEGYLCLSLRKIDNSSFSAQEKADFLAATNVSLLTTPLSETVQNTMEDLQDLQKAVGDSYDKSDFTIVRVETGTEALVDSPNGTRLRCIFQVKQGDSFSLKTTDPGGIYVGVYDTIPHAVRAATGTGSGLIQIITNGYVTEQVSGEILEDGYLSVSLTNGSTAINDSRKQEMIDSLSFFVGRGLTYKFENLNVKIADVSDAFGQPLALYVTPPFMKGVNHRGYSVGAPENTLPAYILSYKHGFRYVECDIAFTADGVPVLLHDATIDRTSDGTGNIGNLTYEQVLQYDFGSWFSSEFAGTKIPTLAEFLSLCRNLGLHPFLEIKSSASYTTEQIQEIVDLVEAYGMKGNVTYLSFNSGYLSSVVSYDESADVMLVVYSISDSVISTAKTLRTGRNIVSIGSQTYTSAEIERCRNNHFPLGVWTIDSAQTIASLDPYISAVTSNSQNAMLIKLTNDKYGPK